ncbi:MAG TPA: pyridoxamine 5'-phosphate oxidase family protein [Trebonia sp.]
MTTLLDPALGPVSDQASTAITGICGDALHAALGPGLARAALADSALLSRIAPWTRDLARGLQYRDRYGPDEPSTADLVTRLADQQVPEDRARSFAETVDLAAALTLGRVTDQALGPGSGALHPVASELAAPWLPALQLGYRIGLVLEILRLSGPGHLASGSTPAADNHETSGSHVRSKKLAASDKAIRDRIMTRPRQALNLTSGECWDLLRGTSLGRVVFTKHALPAIRPVNHLIDGQLIVIRSDLGSAITGHASSDGAVVCYEADDIDPVRHTGWSVIATGTARLITDPAAVRRYQQALQPWVAEPMDQVIAISPAMITGIRLAG